MRVLHIVSTISIRSGVMSMLMNYYRKIDRDKIQFDFLYFDEREETYEEEINSLGGKVIKIESPTKYFKYRKLINIFFKENYGKYQIIHIHEIFMSGFLAKCKRIGGVKKIIVHAHATKFSDNKINNLRNRLLAIPNKFIPDYYFACSKEAGIYCFGKNFEKDGIIIKNAIDLKKFYPCRQDKVIIRKKLEIDDKFVIGHIGNFTPQKNHKFLIKIFREILKKKENSILVLVGDGYLRKEIEGDIKKYDLEKSVLFLGTRKDINKIMRAFDCFLFPSLYEGLGIVLVEAQATNIPCIFSDVVPTDANILKRNNEIISLKKQETIWAEKILSLHNKNYKNIYEVITNAGYNIELEAEKMVEVYYSL